MSGSFIWLTCQNRFAEHDDQGQKRVNYGNGKPNLDNTVTIDGLKEIDARIETAMNYRKQQQVRAKPASAVDEEKRKSQQAEG